MAEVPETGIVKAASIPHKNRLFLAMWFIASSFGGNKQGRFSVSCSRHLTGSIELVSCILYARCLGECYGFLALA
jgi:hypothetical protein